MHRHAADPSAAVRLPSLSDSVIYALRDSLKAHLLLGNSEVPFIAAGNENTALFLIAPIGDNNMRTLTTGVATSAGLVLITVADPRPTAEREARFGLMSTLMWDFVQLDLTLVLVWIGVQLGLRPIKKLRGEIDQRSPFDLRPIDGSHVPREIAPVVVTLNRLFTMLRQSSQAQQQFIADTAHQLRTPIAGMQAQLDVLMAEPAAKPLSTRLATLREGLSQLAHSSNQLLSLARADPTANVAAKRQMVNLPIIVAEVVSKFYDRALSLNIDLGAEAEPAEIMADPSLVEELLGNLVDNALKYTPAGGSVTVISRLLEGKACLAVEDSGPGIPEAERSRVMQRFYRLPNSPGHGSGLGLAIVRDIAALYNATVEIASASGSTTSTGCRITVLFSRV